MQSGLASEQDQLNIKLIPDCDTDLKLLQLQYNYLIGVLNNINANSEGPVLPDCYYETIVSGEPITTISGEIIECL